MAESPDLYETLEIHYPPPRPALSPRCRGCHRPLGTAALLLLAAGLVALVILYAQSRQELRAARAELAAAIDPLRTPEPDDDTPSAAQRRRDQLGRWLQGLALGWRYHRGKLYLFSGQRQPWAAAEAACMVTHGHLASVTSAEEQTYLAREARGGTYWIGLAATGPGGTWRWTDGTPYSPELSFWAPGQPDSTDHGQWGGEHCAQIHPAGAALWNDHNCNFSFPWVCQRDLFVPEVSPQGNGSVP